MFARLKVLPCLGILESLGSIELQLGKLRHELFRSARRQSLETHGSFHDWLASTAVSVNQQLLVRCTLPASCAKNR